MRGGSSRINGNGKVGRNAQSSPVTIGFNRIGGIQCSPFLQDDGIDLIGRNINIYSVVGLGIQFLSCILIIFLALDVYTCVTN